MIWDTAFEGTPAGSDFGSVTSEKLRDLHSLFKTMLSKEHTFDESISPSMTHKSGYCSIVGIDIDDSAIAENAIGEKDGTLKHNNGVVLTSLGTLDHRQLAGLLDSDTHTQYVKKSAPVFNDLTLDDIQGTEVPADPTTPASNEIMGRAAHKPGLGSEGVQHGDKVIADADITVPLFSESKIALKENALTTGTVFTVSFGKSVGSINCFSVDTNYKCYIDPVIGTGGDFIIRSGTSGDITVDTIEV